MDGEGQEKIKWPKDLQAAIWRHRIKKKKNPQAGEKYGWNLLHHHRCG